MRRKAKHQTYQNKISALLAVILAVSLAVSGCSGTDGRGQDAQEFWSTISQEARSAFETIRQKAENFWNDIGTDQASDEAGSRDGESTDAAGNSDTAGISDEGSESGDAIPGSTGTGGYSGEESGTSGNISEQDIQNTASVPFLQSYGYAYEQLSEEEQKIYCVMCDSITSRERMPVQTTDEDMISRCYAAVSADHPEYFYMSGYKLTTLSAGPLQRIYFAAQYTMDAKQQAQYEVQLQSALEAAVNDLELAASADDYTKVKAAFDWIVQHTQYDLDADNNQNVLSVFLNHASVCNGYASAFQYLMYRLGIPCTLITGTAEGQPHAWNLVKADGDWYYVDPTFGDKETSVTFTDYNELCMTSQEMLLNHQIDASSFAVPECTATADSYFIREGRYLKENDAAALQTIVNLGLADPESIIWIRCADHNLYQQILNEVQNYTFSLKYLGGSSLSYTTFEQLYTLWVKKGE